MQSPQAGRKGIYSQLVSRVLEHSQQLGGTSVHSRHVAFNNPALISKLKLGFCVVGYGYFEVFGPIVELKCLLTEQRLEFLCLRSSPLRPSTDDA